MLRAGSHVSDLIFSPGRMPQVELSGQLVPVKIHGNAAAASGRYRELCRSLNRVQQGGDGEIALGWLLRHFLQPPAAGTVPGEYFYATGLVRHRDARHP